MNQTLLIFFSIFTYSVVTGSLLFLVKERFQMIFFMLTLSCAFFLNQLHFAVLVYTNQSPYLAYMFVSFTILAAIFRLLTSSQIVSKIFLLLSLFGSIISVFFFS